MMSYSQLLEDHQRALEQTPKAGDQLPAYAEATKDRSPYKVSEKEVLPVREPQQAPSKMATLKSILKGDVHKHNSRYVLEEAMTGQPRTARQGKDASAMTPQIQWNTDRLSSLQPRRKSKPAPEPEQTPAMSPQMQWNQDRMQAIQVSRKATKSPSRSESRPSESSSMSAQMQWNHERLLAGVNKRG